MATRRPRRESARGVTAQPASEGRTAPPSVVLHADGVDVRAQRRGPWSPHPLVAAGLVLATVVFLLNLTPVVVVALYLPYLFGAQLVIAIDRCGRLLEEAAHEPAPAQLAAVVGDAMRDAGLSPCGSEALDADPGNTGHENDWRLRDVDPGVAHQFAVALRELAAAELGSPYVVPRWRVATPVGNLDGLQVALGVFRADELVWHAVPTLFTDTDAHAQLFAAAWDHWVGGGPAVRLGAPDPGAA